MPNIEEWLKSQKIEHKVMPSSINKERNIIQIDYPAWQSVKYYMLRTNQHSEYRTEYTHGSVYLFPRKENRR